MSRSFKKRTWCGFAVCRIGEVASHRRTVSKAFRALENRLMAAERYEDLPTKKVNDTWDRPDDGRTLLDLDDPVGWRLESGEFGPCPCPWRYRGK